MISIDYSVLLQAANFLALVYILHLLLIKPINKSLAQRELQIEQAEEKSRELAGRLALRREELAARREEARAQAAKVRERLLEEAKTQAVQITDTARKEAEGSTARLEKQLQSDLQDNLRALETKQAMLSQAIAVKLLGRPLL